MCVYVKTRIYLVRNNREKERGQLVLTYMWVCVRVCVSSDMYKSLNLLVIQTHCWRVNAFECIWLSSMCVVCVPPVHRLCVPPSLWTKKFWFLILFEWIDMIYFKFMQVDFIAGQLKFKCADVWVNKTCDLISWPIRILEITYLLRRLFFRSMKMDCSLFNRFLPLRFLKIGNYFYDKQIFNRFWYKKNDQKNQSLTWGPAIIEDVNRSYHDVK